MNIRDTWEYKTALKIINKANNMGKLIKLSETHYIVVDGSEIKVGDWYICDSSMYPKQCVKCVNNSNNKWVEDYLGNQDQLKFSKKITHSTQPLEHKYGSKKQGFNMGVMSSDIELVYDQIKPLSLSVIEEVIYGYNSEKMAVREYGSSIYSIDEVEAFKKGFNAHREFVKGKLFTIDNMREAFRAGMDYQEGGAILYPDEHGFIKSILPKTEWDCKVVDGKIELI